jgi:drug/metabolite transporter (DMT)-like permease
MQKIPLRPSGNAKSATFLGYGSIILWSLSGILTAAVSGIPTFEVLAIAFGVSFLLSTAGWGLWGSFKNLKRPMYSWVLGVVGIYGSESMYVAAFKFAPAAHVDLISSLWPIFVVVFSVFIPNEKFVARYLVASIIGFFGVYCIIFGDQQWISVGDNHWLGYLLALLGALLACVYTLTTHRFCETSIETMSIYAGFCVVFSLILHFQFEVTMMPSTMEWATMISMGLLTQGLAYMLWNHGVRYGNYRLLSILSYGSPIISIFLLIIFGFANATPQLALACVLMCLACLVARTKNNPEETPQLEAA